VAVATAISFGILAGLGGYTFVYARGASYLTDDPRACANCHVMNQQYAGWMAGSHHAVARCNDCHTPPGLVRKYLTKAQNGVAHSWAFTTDRFHEPILIHERNRAVTEEACRKCHQPIVDAIEAHRTAESCLRCHAQVGHP
jgi:cytochrome c nitrite reductase small subunit